MAHPVYMQDLGKEKIWHSTKNDFESFSGQNPNTKTVLETSTEYVETSGAFVG